jgi:hypothetical protein
MSKRKKLHKKIQDNLRVRYSDMEKLFLLYGFEIDKSSGGAHWRVRKDEEGKSLDFPFWRPHGRNECFLSPKTKRLYLEYINKEKKQTL